MATPIFTTAPFNVGNTLTQAAQIQNFRSVNKLREAQLLELDRQRANQQRLNTLFQGGLDPSDPGAINQLAGIPGGLQMAGQVTSLRTDIANQDIAQRRNLIDKTQFINSRARAIDNSKDPLQSFGLNMQDPEFADFVNGLLPGLKIENVTAEGLAQVLPQVIAETDFANDPVAVTELLGGPALEQRFGLQPGTVQPGTIAEVTTERGQPTDVSLLQKPATAGTSLTFNPETGAFEFRQGGPAGAGALTKPTINKLQQTIIDSDNQLSLLSEIGRTFDPSFQQVAGRFQAGKTAVKAKLGFSVSQAEVQQLDRFGEFKRNSIEGINRYIKLITGAQMSELEANRLRRGFPDPGEGLFDGDDPITFQSKYRSVLKQLTLTRARAAWALKNGLVAPDVSEADVRGTGGQAGVFDRITTIAAFEATIRARETQLIEQLMREQGMNRETAEQQAGLIVIGEFDLKRSPIGVLQ